MMGKWGLRESLGLAVGVLLSLSIAYCQGRRAGQLDERLKTNQREIVSNDSVTKSATSQAEASREEASVHAKRHDAVRERVRVVRDTIYVQGDNNSDSVTIVSPEIAQLILSADSTIAAQKRALALQDTLIGSLRQGIALRNQRISLLEKKGNPRFSKGIQAGVGYCATQSGTGPCIYAGYGFSLRLP